MINKNVWNVSEYNFLKSLTLIVVYQLFWLEQKSIKKLKKTNNSAIWKRSHLMVILNQTLSKLWSESKR